LSNPAEALWEHGEALRHVRYETMNYLNTLDLTSLFWRTNFRATPLQEKVPNVRSVVA
jgi:hypothetical protein